MSNEDNLRKSNIGSPNATNAIALKVSIPVLRAFKTKRFDSTQLIKEIIELLVKQLPPLLQSPYYVLYNNGNKLDPEKTLADYPNIGHMETIEFMREPRYEISVLGKRDEIGLLFLDEDVKTMDAIKRIHFWLIPSLMADSTSTSEMTTTKEDNQKTSEIVDREDKPFAASATWTPTTKSELEHVPLATSDSTDSLLKDNMQSPTASPKPTRGTISFRTRQTASSTSISTMAKNELDSPSLARKNSNWVAVAPTVSPTSSQDADNFRTPSNVPNRSSAKTFPPTVLTGAHPTNDQTPRTRTLPTNPDPQTIAEALKSFGPCKLNRKVGNGIRQELIELKELSQYSLRTNDLLELEALAPSGQTKVFELLVEYSPVFHIEPEDEKKLLFENTKRKEDDLTLKKKESLSRKGFTILKDSFKALGNKDKENKEVDSGVGLPYNVIHKQHVNFDFSWSGQKPEDLFELKEELGKGAYGAVYLATHRDTGFTLAVKVVPVTGPGKVVLAKEIEVLKKCKNANVLMYYGMCSRLKDCWILMEYCAVGSIKDLINLTLEPLEEPHIVEVCLGMLKGLAYLHSQKIIHLDIKAANIMLTDDGTVKLGDFGVSAQLRMETTSTSSADLVGSPLYMAPEVIKMERYGTSADIWSLGVTLIEMAEGRPPNNDICTIYELMKLPDRPPPTLKSPKHWSSEFNDFLAKCLVKDQNARLSAIDLMMHSFPMKTKGPDALKPLIRNYMSIKSGGASAF